MIDPAVARRTTDALRDVNRVIEVSEVRQIVHTHPLERLAGFETGPHRFEIRTVRPNLLMTVHADLRSSNTRGRRSLNRGVTVTTVDDVIADVVFMAELNWLLALDVGAGVPT